MKKGRQRIDALTALIILLIIPAIMCFRVILVIFLIFVAIKIILKIRKIILICKQDKLRGYWRENYVDYIHKTDDYEEYLNDKNVQKGTIGEEKIIKILERIFKRENIIHDSYFRDDELVTTQVDIIAVDNTGIYVIESKAYSSVISGKSEEKMWVQLFGNKKYQRFPNPINQNNRHLEAIKNNLKEFSLSDECFKSYVVFGNNCKLDIDIHENCNTKVIQQKDLFYTVLEERKQTENVLTDELISKIARRFRAHANVADEMKIDHIKRRQNKVKYVVKRG